MSKKRKITVKWDFLTQAEYSSLLNQLFVYFNSTEQPVLYYLIKAFNPNNPKYYLDENGVLQPSLEEMIGYLDGKFVGNVAVYNTRSKVQKECVKLDGTCDHKDDYEDYELTIGYRDVSLVFLER